MIVINAVIETNPGTVAALKDAIAAMEKASRAEPGCIDYVFTTEINDSNKVRIVEHWKDLEALKTHFTLPHMAAFRAAMAKSPPKQMTAKMFDATELPFPPR